MKMESLSNESTTTLALDLLLNATGNGSGSPLYVWDRYTQAQLYERYSPAISYIDKYVTPVWYVIGFPGNILTFLVWIQPRMRHSSGCYLAALAMVDFVFLILQMLFELQSVWNVTTVAVPILCEAFPVFFMAFQYMSPLLVLGFTVERYISICHPFQREKFCTTSRAIKVILSLVMLALSLHAIQGYFWHYFPKEHDCSVRMEVAKDGPRSLWSVWSWVTELLVFGVVPLGILVLNIFVIKETRKLSDNEEKVLCLKKGSKSSGASATTFMLLAVSFYLIFTTLPVTVCYALYYSFPEGDLFISDADLATDPVWQRYLTYWTVRYIVQELGMSHYACNFLIYLLTGKMFRRELQRKICKRCHKQSRARAAWNGEFQEVRSTSVKSHRTEVDTNTNGTVAHL